MAWLKTAELIEVVVNNPGKSKSGTCALCETLDGQPVSEVGRGPFHPNCFVADMEVFTDAGWKLWPDVSGQELFLSVDLDTGNAEWVKAKKLISVDYHGPVHRFKSHNVDFAVSPNHTHVVKFNVMRTKSGKLKGRKNAGKWVFEANSTLPKRAYSFLATIPNWQGKNPEKIQVAGEEFKTIDFCRFMAMFLSEGCICRPKNAPLPQIAIAQQKYKKEFSEVLKKIFPKIWIGKTTIYVPHVREPFACWLENFGYSWEKSIPKEIKDLSKEYISEFLYYYALGDGTIRKNIPLPGAKTASYSTYYFSSSIKMAEDLGELILKIGKRPAFCLQPAKWVQHKNGLYLTKHPCWKVTQGSYGVHSKQNIDEEILHYNGKIYDVELEKFHTLIVRRHGQVLVSGNCKCSTRKVQKSLQPADVLDEEFEPDIPEDIDEPREDGGVIDLEGEE